MAARTMTPRFSPLKAINDKNVNHVVTGVVLYIWTLRRGQGTTPLVVLTA